MKKKNVLDVDQVWKKKSNGDGEKTTLKDVKQGMVIKVKGDRNNFLALSDPRTDAEGNVDVDVDELSWITS